MLRLAFEGFLLQPRQVQIEPSFNEAGSLAFFKRSLVSAWRSTSLRPIFVRAASLRRSLEVIDTIFKHSENGFLEQTVLLGVVVCAVATWSS